MEWVPGDVIGHGSYSTVRLATPKKQHTSHFLPTMAVKSSNISHFDMLLHEKSILAELKACPYIIRCFGNDRTKENGKKMYNLFLYQPCLAPRLEVRHMFDGDSRKPADIIFPSWDNGRDLCLDVSIVSLFTSLPHVGGVGEAARKVEERKSAKYEANNAANGLLFRHFVMESTRGFGQRTEEVLSGISVELASVRGCHLLSLLPPLDKAGIRNSKSFGRQFFDP